MEFSHQLQTQLADAKKVTMLSGAGMSAESGVPTFRGDGGIWSRFKPEELANFDAFIKNPGMVLAWYEYRKMLIEKVEPNPGHRALAEMEALFERFTIVTQNVDNLHQRAGSSNVVEVHGNIMRNRCITCGLQFTEVPNSGGDAHIPQCSSCGGYIRPDVVWFGEMLPEEAVARAFNALEDCDMCISVGTSGIVYPAASFAGLAKQHGAFTVEININETALSHEMDEVITGPAGKVMPGMLQLLKN